MQKVYDIPANAKYAYVRKQDGELFVEFVVTATERATARSNGHPIPIREVDEVTKEEKDSAVTIRVGRERWGLPPQGPNTPSRAQLIRQLLRRTEKHVPQGLRFRHELFSKWLRTRPETRDVTAEALGYQSGSTLRGIEVGNFTPNKEALWKIAELMRLEVEDLLEVKVR